MTQRGGGIRDTICGIWILATALLISVAACGSTEADNATPEALSVEIADSAGRPVISFSHTLHEVAGGAVALTQVQPDLLVGDEEDLWFGVVTDITSLPDGRFAVFDRIEKQITVVDSLGNLVDRFGREGGGPGEYEYPWALTAVGNNLVAWQRRPSSTFTVIGDTGQVMATGAASIAGDWAEPTFRFPLMNLEGMQHGPEDVTRRLVALGDSGFVVQLQMNEKDTIDWNAPVDFQSPPTYLIRYGLDARVRDTLAVLSGPRTLLWDRLPADGQVLAIYEQPLFSARPVWAVGDGWLATGHGDSSSVIVRNIAARETLSILRWPERRGLVTDDDKIEAAKWLVATRIVNSEDSREMFENDSPAERRKGIEMEAFEILPFADSAPRVTAGYGAGDCLFLAGYSPEDWADATSLTWLAFNVRRPSLEAVFRLIPPSRKPLELERRGGAVRHLDQRFAYAVFRDWNGVFLVQRYRLPEMDCG